MSILYLSSPHYERVAKCRETRMTDFPICYLAELPQGRAIAREILLDDRKAVILLLVKDGHCSGFLNSCPHTGVQLEWRPDDLMDPSNSYLQCSMHGALFQTDSGLCIEGPCVGDGLFKLEIELRDGIIYLLNGEKIPESARGHS